MSYTRCSYKKSCSSTDEEEFIQLKEDIKGLKKDNLLLICRIEKLEKLINDMILYQPEGEGYQATKTHFETINIK